MRAWSFPVSLDPASGVPLFLQIARALEEDVRRGRLRPGAPLPSSRALARELGVHRNTVLAALRELEAQGWLETRPAQGTYISLALPEPRPRAGASPLGPAPRPDAPGFPLSGRAHPREVPPPHALALWAGSPDTRLVPTELLARAFRRALRRQGARLLDYTDGRGHAGLRRVLAQMLSETRGLALDEDGLLVTRGSQAALDLAARTLLSPGARVAVETPGYRPAWEVLRLAGASLVPVPVDAQGLDVDALARAHAEAPLRAVYLTPHHQYPTTVTLSAARRLRLLAWAARERVALLEDDYDHEFHYEGRPVLPLASADRSGVVVYVGTLSKVLAPGLRLGYLVAPRAFIERALAVREAVDRQGETALEAAVAELLEDGEVARHVRRVRGEYRKRRDALVEMLGRELPHALQVTPPAGGLTLWAPTPFDAYAWAARALEEGVAVQPGGVFSFDGTPLPALRLGFASLTPRELAEAVRRLARAVPMSAGSARRTTAPGPRRSTRSQGA
ncbi:PLP-dependent aminotransferase family protein [Myxococcus sp. RHSTA-1-4]|uniref:MocR-like pyridoxine biosynthesis transcription factor PdxR n=1 Tax=Myxococcus sp. RHSTA-1-4 TaxID=2874601 RepID=UPI001CBE434E|nr:PLP-dependent aminotransferase family protein [Myxococcus sp. RHSTA-1-4]MBZ4419504.1 PLP-dependent aminotransferase family protein [Myxococcus sp. RHSTA-1-4]